MREVTLHLIRFECHASVRDVHDAPHPMRMAAGEEHLDDRAPARRFDVALYLGAEIVRVEHGCVRTGVNRIRSASR